MELNVKKTDEDIKKTVESNVTGLDVIGEGKAYVYQNSLDGLFSHEYELLDLYRPKIKFSFSKKEKHYNEIEKFVNTMSDEFEKEFKKMKDSYITFNKNNIESDNNKDKKEDSYIKDKISLIFSINIDNTIAKYSHIFKDLQDNKKEMNWCLNKWESLNKSKEPKEIKATEIVDNYQFMELAKGIYDSNKTLDELSNLGISEIDQEDFLIKIGSIINNLEEDSKFNSKNKRYYDDLEIKLIGNEYKKKLISVAKEGKPLSESYKDVIENMRKLEEDDGISKIKNASDPLEAVELEYQVRNNTFKNYMRL